ncbi:secreted RxLR effector protein 161-like [Phragmites australis]|uniref:secreted RxLR effector protein 161-like n=1 Tax=Phragmites australis TaxID=29695 RepID=UPI002D78005B|nr:secreted RxLR effector protein 161-like [Phragmites australis]
MEQRLKLSKASSAPPVDATEYQSIIGSLRYLVHSCPNLAFSVGYASRFMENPTAEHLAAMKRILCYVAGTIDFGCYYTKKGIKEGLIGFSDSDIAGDVDTRKSTSGILFFFGSSLVSWQSQKQRVIALSSCGAEYIVATTTACQSVWLAQLIRVLTDEQPDAFKLNIDN